MSENEKYPSPKEALLGGDAVANIRCAIKYVAWHTTYLLFTVLGLLLMGTLIVGNKIADAVPTTHIHRAHTRVDVKLSSVFSGRAPENITEWVGKWMEIFIMLAVVISTILLIVFLWLLVYKDPMLLLVFAVIPLGVILLVGIEGLYLYVTEETEISRSVGSGIQKTKERAVETPGVRRVYGECPVSFDIEPRWAQKIKEKFDG